MDGSWEMTLNANLWPPHVCTHTWYMCPHIHPVWHRRFTEVSPVPRTFSFFLFPLLIHIPCFCFTDVCLGKGGNWERLKVETWFTSVHLWASFGSFWEERGMHLGIQEEVAVSWGISLAQTQSRSWTQAVLQGKKLDRMSPGLSKPRAYSFHKVPIEDGILQWEAHFMSRAVHVQVIKGFFL